MYYHDRDGGLERRRWGEDREKEGDREIKAVPGIFTCSDKTLKIEINLCRKKKTCLAIYFQILGWRMSYRHGAMCNWSPLSLTPI